VKSRVLAAAGLAALVGLLTAFFVNTRLHTPVPPAILTPQLGGLDECEVALEVGSVVDCADEGRASGTQIRPALKLASTAARIRKCFMVYTYPLHRLLTEFGVQTR